jgi:hypothetical protein
VHTQHPLNRWPLARVALTTRRADHARCPQQLKEIASPEEPDLEAVINPKKRAKTDAAKARSAVPQCQCVRSRFSRLRPQKAKEDAFAALPNLNPALCAVFEELAEAHFSAKETMKAVAYKKVAKALRETEQVITAGKQAQKLPGIGKSSAEKASASACLLCLRAHACCALATCADAPAHACAVLRLTSISRRARWRSWRSCAAARAATAEPSATEVGGADRMS